MIKRGVARRRWAFLGGVGLGALIMTANPVLAAHPGALDPTFSQDGMTWIGFGDDDGAYAVFRDGRGRLVLAGGSQDWNGPNASFALTRLTPTGQRDTTYGRDGRTVFDPTSSKDIAVAAAVGPDGKVVIAGIRYHKSDSLGYVLARFKPTGRLDRSFGEDGVVTGTFLAGAGSQRVDDVLVQPDGRILVIGEADHIAVVRRYLAGGRRDAAFGTSGRIRIAGVGRSALLRQANGRLIVVWSTVRSGRHDTAPIEVRARRYTVAGVLDRSFGANGLARIKLLAADIDRVDIGAAAFGSDGRIYVAGTAWNNATFRSNNLVAAFTAGGKPATAFGGTGWRSFDVGNVDRLEAILGLPDGRVVVGGGYAESVFGDPSSEPGHLVLMVLRQDGSPDPGFGQGGTVDTAIKHGTHPPGADYAVAFALLVTGDRLIVAGASGGDYNSDFLAARYYLGSD